EDALVTLGDAGLVNVKPDGVVAFAHPFLADVAYDAIPVDARRQFHAEVLEELEKSGAKSAVLGHHGYEAGIGSRAVVPLERAGLDCQAAFDDHGAPVHYRRAWELARWAFLRGDDADGRVLSRIGLRLGEAMYWSGDAVAVEGVLAEALEHSAED